MVKNESEEINLLDLFANFFAVLRRNIFLSFAIPLTGAAAGVIYHFSSADIWESSVLVETSLLSAQEGEFLFEQLKHVELLPGLTKEQQKQVRRLTFKVISEHSQGSGLNEKSIYLQVTARVVNKNAFPILEKALIDIINTSPPLVRHRAERQLYYDEVIAKIDTEIEAMENVKSQISSKAQATFLNPSLLYAQTLDLFREKMSLHIRKKEIQTVHLVKGFDSLSFERKPALSVMIVVGLIAGMAILAIVLFIKFFLSYLAVYLRTH